MALRDEANKRHLEMHEAKWQEYLWDAQIREYRSSRRMDMAAVYKWCDSAKDLENKMCRYMAVANALQYPVVVFYGLGDAVHLRGFRYGTNGHEYVSGFGALEDTRDKE
jgi:hypothetical protein